MAQQRAAFGHALRWVLGELIAQRSDEPVAFLAQLGRDHRKYGVKTENYKTLSEALYSSFRDQLSEHWNAAVDETARDALALITGVMSGAAEAESGPAWWDGTVVEHQRVSRDLAVVRLQLDRPMDYHAGQYVNVQVPQCPRRWRYLCPAIPADPGGAIEFHVRSVLGGLVSSAIVGETVPGHRWRLSAPHGAMEIDRNGGDVLMVAGGSGLAPLRALIMDLAHFASNPRVHLFFGARYPCELYDLPTLWSIAVPQSVAVGVAGDRVQPRPRVGRELPRRQTAARAARAADRPAARGRHEVRRLGGSADSHQRRPADDREHQSRSHCQRCSAGTNPARSAGWVS